MRSSRSQNYLFVASILFLLVGVVAAVVGYGRIASLCAGIVCILVIAAVVVGWRRKYNRK